MGSAEGRAGTNTRGGGGGGGRHRLDPCSPSVNQPSVNLLPVKRIGVHPVHVNIHQLPLELGAIPGEVAQLVVPRAAHRLRRGGESGAHAVSQPSGEGRAGGQRARRGQGGWAEQSPGLAWGARARKLQGGGRGGCVPTCEGSRGLGPSTSSCRRGGEGHASARPLERCCANSKQAVPLQGQRCGRQARGTTGCVRARACV